LPSFSLRPIASQPSQHASSKPSKFSLENGSLFNAGTNCDPSLGSLSFLTCDGLAFLPVPGPLGPVYLPVSPTEIVPLFLVSAPITTS